MGHAGLEIGARLDLAAAEDAVVEAFTGQRRRLLESCRELPAAAWEERTRCSAWNARELVVHVLGATSACRVTLTGERPVFDGGFDPNSSPNQFVDLMAAVPITQTLDELANEIDRTGEVIETLRARTPAPQVTAVWGEPVDWRLFVTHMFWDGWMHERDLMVPLGESPATSAGETRLATAYALHCAGIMTGLLGAPIDTTLRLGGIGRGSYHLVAEGTDVRVTVSDADTATDAGDAIAVNDAIAGRGPQLDTVLDAPPETVATLAQLGTFLNGDSAAPSLPDD